MPEARRSITYVLPFTPTVREVEVWGLSVLASHGFEVSILDVGPLLRSGIPVPPDAVAAGDWPLVRTATISDLRRTLEQRANGFVVDFVAGMSDVGLREARLYTAMQRAGVSLIVVKGGLVPSAPSARLGLLETVRRVTDPYRVANLPARAWIRARRARSLGFAPPVAVFAAASEERRAYARRYPTVDGRVFSVSSFDYDRYMEMAGAGALPDADGTCLFIDDGVAGHPDFAYLGLRSVDPRRYFCTMRGLFDRVEKATGLRVRVAAHPKSDVEVLRDGVGDREIVKGDTLALTAKATCVITHASTAVSYAVLLERPLLLVTTGGMRETGYDARVRAVAHALGLTPLDGEDPLSLSGAALDPGRWPTQGFASYRDRYVVDPTAPCLPVWEIVARELAVIAHGAGNGVGLR